MTVSADKPAPYAPSSTVLDVIARYRDRGLPTPITKDVLLRAGVSQTVIPRVLQSLQMLDLMDDDGRPTDTFEGIRKAPEAEYKQRLAEWLNAAYADALRYVDPATADEAAVRDAFRNYQPIGQQSRMVALFIALFAAAGIGSPEKKSSAPRPVTGRITVTPRSNRLPIVDRRNASTDRRPDKTSNLPEPIAGMMAGLPPSGWTQGDRDNFLKAFTAVLDFCVPIKKKSEIDKESESADDAQV